MSCFGIFTRKRSKVFAIIFTKVDISFNCITCPICLEDFGIDKYLTLTCGHKFHADCILEWFTRQMTCPICRKKYKWKKSRRRKNT